MSVDNILTKQGYDKLKEELDHLRKVSRVEVAEKIREAREVGGDYQENSLYDTALEEQGYIEGRISEIETILSGSVIADTKDFDGTVQVGRTVIVEYAGRTDEFTIVGTSEADPSRKFISNESPVGKALLGLKIGDEIEVKTPLIVAVYKIIDIK